jgi:hypothetical protein
MVILFLDFGGHSKKQWRAGTMPLGNTTGNHSAPAAAELTQPPHTFDLAPMMSYVRAPAATATSGKSLNLNLDLDLNLSLKSKPKPKPNPKPKTKV